MNIFYLDDDIKKCAQAHCDKHVIKMILESAQILCTILNLQGVNTPYSSTHVNHPCVKWARESLDNWLWLRSFVRELNNEYMYRYNKATPHKSAIIVEQLSTPNLPATGLTERPKCMPNEYKTFDVIKSYRNYYNGAKKDLLRYTKRDKPTWIS